MHLRKKLSYQLNYPPLQELKGALVLGDLQQLHNTLFIRSMARNLLNDVPDELGVFGQFLNNQDI